MGYPVTTCSKSLILVMGETHKTPRAASFSISRPSSHVLTVNIKLTFKSVYCDWVMYPPYPDPELVRRFDGELKQNSISFDHRQFLSPQILRDTIAGEIADWPLSPEERHELAGIAVYKAAVVVGPSSPTDTEHVYVSFRVVENHRHSSGNVPPPATVLLGAAETRIISQNVPCPRSSVTFLDINV